MNTRYLLSLVPVILFVSRAAAAPQEVEFKLHEPGLKAVVIDHNDTESFLGLQLDSAGRLYAGCREALFVYEPAPGGLYQPPRLLFKFPKDSWVYDIAVRGTDLYVATHTAIYLMEGAVTRREGLQAKRLVWGLPMMEGYDMHQGVHGMAFGPEGDLYFNNGDEIINYGGYGRPDHWSHWTYFHGSKSTRVTGCGGTFKISPDGEKFEVIASGTRNTCGLSFDRNWNLFAPDNDHESLPNLYVPGRLLHLTQGAYYSWPRGWMPEKAPWRADMLATMHPDLGRYVPTGQAYYDDTFLPESCANSLYVAEWSSGKLLRYPLTPEGASFKVEQKEFLSCPPEVRPVGVTVGRGGRIFTSVCHMKGNEASPIYQSEIVMITRADDTDAAPFQAWEDMSRPVESLYQALESPSWQASSRAHMELLRRGPSASAAAAGKLEGAKPGTSFHNHLLWLAAAGGALDKVVPYLTSPVAETRHQALRAVIRFGPGPDTGLLEKALDDSNLQVVQVALAALRKRPEPTLEAKVLLQAHGTDRLLRQSAVQVLAAGLTPSGIQELCESESAPDRLTGILVAGQRLTMPPLEGPLPDEWPLDPMASVVPYADGTVDLPRQGRLGNFTMAEVWAKMKKSPEAETLFALLERRLHDSVSMNAQEAAFFLRLLKDSRTDSQCAEILGIHDDARAKQTPLAGASSEGITELPDAYRNIDWEKQSAGGDAEHGARLFTERGCYVCHAAKPGDAGGGGPSLTGAGSRFSVAYLVDAVITPNKSVSPIFQWTLLTKRDGAALAGLITGETAEDLEVLLPAGVRQTVKKADVIKREQQARSPMPEGLVRSPQELGDLLAYLTSLK